MGRVHKKKIAEYTEAEENKSKEKGAEVDGEKDAGSESDIEEISKDANDSAVRLDGVIDTHSDDDDFKSLQGDNVEQEKNSSNGSGGAGDAKKSHKRKPTSGSADKVSTKIKSTKPDDAADERDSDDEPLNGAAIAGTSKKRKIAVTTRKEKFSPKAASGKAGVRGSKREKVVVPGKKAYQSDQEEEYEVKEIIDHKIERGVSHFLIRWKGYTKDDDTWEPESTLNCSDLIEKFKKKQSANGSKSIKKTTKPLKKVRAKKEDEEEKEWEVEKIVDYAEERSGRVFLIRWKGFTAKDDTWEPEENLRCSDIIEKFLKRMKSQENISVKELREEPKKTKRLVNEAVRSFNALGRKSKRATTKKSVYYGDSDD